MAKSRFTGRYSRWRRRRLWRIRRVRQVAGKRTVSRRGILWPILAAELGYGGWHYAVTGGYEIRLIRLEEEYQIEWQIPGKAEPAGKPKPVEQAEWLKPVESAEQTARNEAEPASEDRIYGVRIHPDRLELEFYRREPVEPSLRPAKESGNSAE